MIDSDSACINTTDKFYKRHPDSCIFPPINKCAIVSPDNINSILSDNGIIGEIDLFSLDVDGIDYWLWESLTIVRPRVVILEAVAFWESEKSVSIPYIHNFNRFDKHLDYMGASIPAFIKLGKQKGYRLVACNRYGFNLMFIRNDIGKEQLPEIDVKDCFHFLPKRLEEIRNKRLSNVIKYKWVEV